MSNARRLAVTVGVVALLLGSSSVRAAFASWSSGGTGKGRAAAANLGVAVKVVVAPASTTSMTITSTTDATDVPTGYQTERISPAATVCASVNPCTDGSRTAGNLYSYNTTAKQGTWLGTTSSPTIGIGANMPTTTLFATGLGFGNGSGTATLPDPGDSIVVTLSAAPTMASICSTWSTGTLTGLTVTMNRGNGSATNTITVTSAACTLHLGSFTTTGSAFIPTNNTTPWTSSTLALSGTTLTLTFGTCSCGNVVQATGMTYTFSPDAAMKTSGNVTISGTASIWGDLF